MNTRWEIAFLRNFFFSLFFLISFLRDNLVSNGLFFFFSGVGVWLSYLWLLDLNETKGFSFGLRHSNLDLLLGTFVAKRSVGF